MKADVGSKAGGCNYRVAPGKAGLLSAYYKAANGPRFVGATGINAA